MEVRYTALDVLKGITIILVVLGHVLQTIISPEGFDNNILFKVIYSFHMPLFLFISGYLVGKKDRLTFRWLGRKTIRLLIPFCSWLMVDFFIDGGRTISDLKYMLQKVYNDPSDGGRWFLLCLFECCLFIFICANINEKVSGKVQKDLLKKIIPVILILIELFCLAVVWFLTGFSTVLGLRLLCKEIIYFVAGYYINKFPAKHDNSICKRKKLIYIAFPCLVLFWDRTHFVTFYMNYIYTGDILLLSMVANAFKVVYYYSVSFLGIAFMWNIVKNIRNATAINILSNIGQYTMEIYILHMYMWVTCFESKWVNALLSLVLGVGIPIVIGKIVRKEKHLSCLMFGH